MIKKKAWIYFFFTQNKPRIQGYIYFGKIKRS